ncbi:efflux transporter outer membrane subunit [Pelistega europaea]|uniref:Efflux transporter outer membrane subunit n=1 Tax=Pelistega europaea TaxID=106147 RepID=A0A7Y4L8H4_9BURK|nr:efflux transporter outer membrane subunit [Pelistega europaea]NOL48919.1 efflux transporter outer membrane subunit [Pelistega europaea]
MSVIARLSVLSSSILLAACNFAPKYEAPAAPLGAQYQPVATGEALSSEQKASEGEAVKVTTNEVVAGSTAADLGWKTFFTDPRLKAFIELGLANNRDLLVATKNVEIAKKQYGIQLSNLFPSVGASFTQSAQNLPADMSAMGVRNISRSYIAGVGITNFELDFFGKIRNQNEASLQAYFATEQAQRTAQINLVASIANTYFSIRSLNEMEQLINSIVDAYGKTYQLTLSRFKAGVASQVDVNQAQSTFESAKASLAETRRNRAQAVNALSLLIGQDVPSGLPAAAPFGKDVIMSNIPVGLPSDLLTRRPDIMAAEHNLKAANANIGAARAAFFPSISLTALLGVASPELSNLFSPHQGRDMWTFSPSISLPIYSFGALKNSLDVAELSKDVQIATYQQTIQTAFSEVNDALVGVQTYKEQLDALRAQTAAAEQSLKLAMLRYTSGVDDFLAVQSAQVALLNVKQNFLSVGLASLQNKVSLYKALGGGWSAEDVKKK